MTTKHPITVYWGWLPQKLILPSGTRLVPASNLPPGTVWEGKRWWVKSLPRSLKASRDLRGWHRIYGLLIDQEHLRNAEKEAGATP